MTDTATVTAETARSHLGDAARSAGHAAKIGAERAKDLAGTGYGHVKTGLTSASDSIKANGVRGAGQAFWKAKPLATIALTAGATVLAVHTVGHAFAGPKSQERAMARDAQRGGPQR